MRYDVFICHASEDKLDFVEPLVRALTEAGVTVWYDDLVLEWGDSLRAAIEHGLSQSRYGLVVFSPAFLNRKRWTEHEFDALFARESSGNKIILPIWHKISREDLAAYSPSFADRLAKNSAKDSIEQIVADLKRLLAGIAGSPAKSAEGFAKDWQESIEEYSAEVVQVAGPGSRLVTKTAWMMSGDHGYLDPDRFVFVKFNSGGDIINVWPKDGYELIRCSSPSGNLITYDGSFCQMVLEEKLKNSIVIFCKTKSVRST